MCHLGTGTRTLAKPMYKGFLKHLVSCEDLKFYLEQVEQQSPNVYSFNHKAEEVLPHPVQGRKRSARITLQHRAVRRGSLGIGGPLLTAEGCSDGCCRVFTETFSISLNRRLLGWFKYNYPAQNRGWFRSCLRDLEMLPERTIIILG